MSAQRTVTIVVRGDGFERFTAALERADRAIRLLEYRARRARLERLRRELVRADVEATRWRRDPRTVLWGGRYVDYQFGSLDDMRRSTTKAALRALFRDSLRREPLEER